MRLHHLVEYEDGTSVEVKAGPADVVAWEHEHRSGLNQRVVAGFSDWMFWVLWHSLVRHGETDASFTDWLNTVADSNEVREDADVLPPVETPGPSPDS